MFLIYKNLVDKYEHETESESLALSSAICRLWYPINYNSFKPESNLSNYLTQIIILTFLLKYYNNAQAMVDFNLALKEFYEKDLDFSPISQLCEKYGKNISLVFLPFLIQNSIKNCIRFLILPPTQSKLPYFTSVILKSYLMSTSFILPCSHAPRGTALLNF